MASKWKWEMNGDSSISLHDDSDRELMSVAAVDRYPNALMPPDSAAIINIRLEAETKETIAFAPNFLELVRKIIRDCETPAYEDDISERRQEQYEQAKALLAEFRAEVEKGK